VDRSPGCANLLVRHVVQAWQPGEDEFEQIDDVDAAVSP
jgi:hypothetical protein